MSKVGRQMCIIAGAATANAYVSTTKTPPSRSGLSHGKAAVAKTLRESGVRFRSLNSQTGSVRLRRCLGSTTSCHFITSQLDSIRSQSHQVFP